MREKRISSHIVHLLEAANNNMPLVNKYFQERRKIEQDSSLVKIKSENGFRH